MALRRGLQLALVAALAIAVAGCGGSKKSALNCKAGEGGPSGGRKQSPPTQALDASKTYTATLKTNYGSFTVKLATKESPNTAASFVYLVDNGFYNGLTFHRIVPGFVIQGGDPTGTGDGGPGYECVDTPPANATYTHGVVAMAKTETDPAGTSGSQFFVVTSQNANLPPDYAILGTVTSGLAVVDKIGTFGNAAQVPTKRVVIEKATVHVS
jgi:peptidyl-prolyl cis-trans isomerase B (cyclophilin B)